MDRLNIAEHSSETQALMEACAKTSRDCPDDELHAALGELFELCKAVTSAINLPEEKYSHKEQVGIAPAILDNSERDTIEYMCGRVEDVKGGCGMQLTYYLDNHFSDGAMVPLKIMKNPKVSRYDRE